MIDFGNSEYSTYAIENTEAILNSIASHLASKQSCRGSTYRVAIGMYDVDQRICATMWAGRDCSNSIFFESKCRLQPHNGHTRKFGQPVIQHIMMEHFRNIFEGAANGNQAYYKYNSLVRGIYEYKMSTTGKYRKWVKIQ